MSKPLTVVVGFGETGLSCIRYLRQQGNRVAVTDSRVDPPGLMALKEENLNIEEIALGEISPSLCAKADVLVVSPGVSLGTPPIAAHIAAQKPVLGDIALFVEACKAPIIGITGSNGKTTVTTLMGEIVKQAGYRVKVGGNIGEPVLNLLQEEVPDYYVLELSSFQLETTPQFHSKTSVILNVTPDHLDRHGNLETYIAIKKRVYLNCQCPVINADEWLTWVDAVDEKQAISFGIDKPAHWHIMETDHGKYFARQGEPLFACDQIRLQGRHHQSNILACFAMAEALGIAPEVVFSVWAPFTGLPHRCERVAEVANVTWINDSKGTNVGATQAAIRTIGEAYAPGKIILLLGGLGKGADFVVLREPVIEYVRDVIIFGQDRPLIEDALQNTKPLHVAGDFAEVIQKAQSLAKSGDVVLFSPACASFDMFRNYEHRGECFRELVLGLT